ncbi:MAG TPA: DivIVA domain-containing protein [Actinomycetota bacterium]|nr:DivIVA domain-containing protein [Actinomycetota bacterium]
MRKKKQDTQEAGFTTPATRPRLTPIDVQQKEFRLAFRGYNERDVDEFLDLVTEELAAVTDENRRLQDHGEPNLASGGGADVTWASREAEGILERARADAASTVAEAEERAAAILAAAGVGPADPRGVIAPYLNREREFLQSLGQLVQQHADSVRRMVRSAKEQAAAPSPGARSSAREDVDEGSRVRIQPAGNKPAPASPQPRAEDAQTEPAPGRHRSVRELFWGEE